MDQQQLLAAYGVLKNQSASLELQQKIVDSNNQLLAAQKETERKAILAKLTDLLMQGVASDYEDPVFRKKVSLFLSSAEGSSYKGAVLDQIADVAPSLFTIWIDAYKDTPVQESYGDISTHPVQIIVDKYRYGFKKIQKDPKLTFVWARKGAELKLIRCMVALSYFYMDGEHGEADYLESEKWSKLIAEAGQVCGVENQARLYSEGLGRKKDVHKAKEILASGLKSFADKGLDDRARLCRALIQLEEAWTDGSEDEHYWVYKGCFEDNDFSAEHVWREIDIEKYVSFHRKYLEALKNRKDDLIGVLNYLSVALPAFPESEHRDSLLAQVTLLKGKVLRSGIQVIMLVLLGLGGLILIMHLTAN